MSRGWNILRNLLSGNYREVARVALPLIVGMGVFTVMQFCDRLFLARHSGIAIQAALPAGILSFTFICGFQALAGYAGTFVAQYHGAGRPEGCVRATMQGIWLSLASVPLLLLGIPLGFLLMDISGHAPEVVVQERIYFGWLMLGGGLLPLAAAIGGYFTGQSRMRLHLMANVLGSLVNILLDYLLIFGKAGFPAMGIRGAAIATVIAGAVAPLVQWGAFLREPAVRAMSRRTLWRPDMPMLRRLVRFGLPAGLHTLADVMAFTFFVMMTGRLGAVSLAASNIGFSINNLAFSPLFGMGFAASILVGQYQGRGQPDRAARAGWTTLKLSWAYMGVVALSFWLFPEAYFSLFRSNNAEFTVAELVRIGRPMMLMMAVWGMFDTVNIVLSSALRGAGDTRFVMVYMMAMGWLLWIPGEIWILMRGGGILPAWRWLTVYVAILSTGFAWRWSKGTWRQIELIQREFRTMP